MYLFCRIIIMYKTTVSVVRSFHDKKNPARQAFYVMRNRNFLLQKNTACQAVFTALTSGIEYCDFK